MKPMRARVCVCVLGGGGGAGAVTAMTLLVHTYKHSIARFPRSSFYTGGILSSSKYCLFSNF